MSSKNRLDAIRLKIKRAAHHIAELNTLLLAFRSLHPYEVDSKPHRTPELDHTTLYVKSIADPPEEFPLIVGDAIHNMRSALDHLVWHLVEVGGGTPNKDTFFPICVDPDGRHKFQSAIGKGEIKKIPKGADKVLLAAQPYVSGNDTLRLIHDLDINDKHRLLITIATCYEEWSIMLGGSVELRFDQYDVRPLQAGDEIVNMPTSTFERESIQNYKLRIDVAFGQSEVVQGKPIVPTLNEFLKFTDGVISQFEAFLS